MARKAASQETVTINAEKRAKFAEVAGRRIDKIITGIRQLSNCANWNGYNYTEEDIKKMSDAIEGELEAAFKLFAARGKGAKKAANFMF